MWVIPIGCFAPVLLCGGFVALVFTLVFGLIKNSEPYTQSLAAVRDAPQVQQTLGEPIEAGWMVTGSVNISGASGDADIAYSVTGPKGSGTVFVVAQKVAGQWTFDALAVRIEETGQRIDLLPAAEGQLNGGQP